MKKLLLIAGTRPNFIKLAPLFHKIKNNPKFKVKICHTGQHFDSNMSDVFWSALDLPLPDYQLNIKGGNVVEIIGKTLLGINDMIVAEKFDGIIVFGDVNATVAGAIAAAQSGVALFHVESGLRSYDRGMPEEINRIITDHISNVLFVSEPSGIVNLEKEGIDASKMVLVGNIMIECLLNTKDKWSKITMKPLINDFIKNPYLIATFHRPENVDFEKNLTRIIQVLTKLSEDQGIIFPLHPRTKVKLEQFNLLHLLQQNKKILLTDPLPYFEFLKLMNNSVSVITDSGGVQEESSFLNKPCITFRNNTERPITQTNGTNLLASIWDDNFQIKIKAHIDKVHQSQNFNIELWDNLVSERIIKHIENYFTR